MHLNRDMLMTCFQEEGEESSDDEGKPTNGRRPSMPTLERDIDVSGNSLGKTIYED